MEGKKAAGRMAADWVEDGTVIGLGTGSTVRFALERLAERIKDEGLRIRGVPTSRDTEGRAKDLGIPLTTLDDEPALALTIDGADEVGPGRALIKGGGGALLREKIVAAASGELVVIVDERKVVDRLGVDFLLPVEVLTFGLRPVCNALAALGCEAFVRSEADGRAFVSDNGHSIVDCRFASGIADPAGLETQIDAIPGVVESGLFVGLAGRVIVGHDDGRTALWD